MRTNASRLGRKAALAATAATLAIFFADPALAQSKPADDDTTASDNADQIVVIGTRREDRSAVNSASPVDVIGAQDLTSQGTSNLMDAVRNVVPSFYVGQNTISDASSFVRAPSLRGLPGDEILVMLNGKRFNRSPLVQVYTGGDTALSFGSHASDISVIPAIAIKNLQVLRDGATAQYGSDAIGGVLNYGLRDNAGLELQARYGQYYDHGDGKSYDIAGNVGVKLGDRGFINLSGEYFDDGQTSRGATRPIAVRFAALNPSLASQLPNYPMPVQNWGSSPVHGYRALLNSAYDVTDNSQLYLFVNVAHSRANESFNYRSPISLGGFAIFNGTTSGTATVNRNAAFAHPIYLTACPAVATCPTGGFVKSNLANTQQTYNFSTLYPAGFTPRFVGVVDQAYGVAGYKGDAGALHYDLSGSLSRSSLDLSMYNSLSPSYGSATQTSFKFGKLIQTEMDANLDMTYEVEAGLASPVTLSWGAEYRHEGYEQTAGDPQSYGAGPYASQNLYVETAPGVYAFDSTVTMPPGASGYGGTSPQFAGKFKQNSYGAYVGLETDLTKALSVGLAGRWEHYDSFGDAWVGKANAILHLTDTFALRGTVGTGFHAPSPGQNNVSILTTNFVAGNQVQTGTYPTSSSIAQFYGAVPLKPAKSTNYGLGFVFNPTPQFTLTVDGYSIKVRDRIGISQNFTVTAANVVSLPALNAVGVGGVVNYFTNAFNTSTDGVDVVATYRTEALGGKLNLTAAYNYNLSRVTKFDPALIGPAQLVNIRHLAPNHRTNLSANWTSGPWTINARENYYGSWQNETDYPGQVFGSRMITDLDVSYAFTSNYTLTVGANDLFNTKPNRIQATASNPIYLLTNSTADGQIYPRNGGPFGFNGGFWYVRLQVKY
ncbi:MAG: TonB-dependent receptor plug domain-containing protein [Novosphingobium sp.]